MKLTITIKVMSETEKELQDLGGHLARVKAHYEELHTQGYLGEPAAVELRWLVVGGRYFPPAEGPLPVTVEEVPNKPVKEEILI